MHVVKRGGRKESVHFDKITARIVKLCYGLNMEHVEPILISQKVIAGLYPGVTTVELDNLAAETAATLTTKHPDYAVLAARIAVSNLHKETKKVFSEVMEDLYNWINPKTKKSCPMISEETYTIIQENSEYLNSAIVYDRDFNFSYFGFKTMERSYLLKIDRKTAERPQHMFMRVAIGIHGRDIDAAVETHSLSKSIVPMLRVVDECARHVMQGGGKRPGAFAIYLEPWHADIFDFLDCKKNTGKEEQRARDLFYALWIPDLFMRRVENDEMWSLMCPHESPGLFESWGKEFEDLYTSYEKEGRFRHQIKAQELWYAIIEAQVETGTPYMLYKDACNRKSNQQNLGTIKCSNLCTEIVEYCSKDEVAVCNLASIAMNMYVKCDGTYDFQKLYEVTKVVTRNLNKIIDVNYYPVPEAGKSNRRHRPIGIGVQGLADAFILMRYPFDSSEAFRLNRQIFETVYYGALEASCELAQRDGPYETYPGCPLSRGILQYDMWNVVPTDLWDWGKLKEKIAKYGVRNSLLLAPMPTASTAQILGNNESMEPYTSNIYTRRVLSGEFQVVNPHLMKDLVELGIWDETLKNEIMANNGSIQGIESLPKHIKDLYKTVWEISQKTIIKMAADRGAFIDQSQSLNIHMAEPSYGRLTSMHFYGWKKGLKTGMYYLRTKPATNAIQFTVDKLALKQKVDSPKPSIKSVKPSLLKGALGGILKEQNRVNNHIDDLQEKIRNCSLNNPESCEMCSG